ncbi:MAG TPA: hypothetical protein VMV47_01800 [Bacteroidales bacterium]|nr:hypothetical protein [Bacteroidales bacterium]
MPELSLYDIDQISRDIRRQEISFSHLLEELIDHVCCDVENEMQKGMEFSEAYKKVNKKIGVRRIKEIQEETLYAVDTKYRIMKKTMKISGIAGTVLLGNAALFKIMHWPLGATMLLLGSVILAFVFIPSALGVLWKETHSGKRLLLYISAFFAGMLFIAGTLFKVQHWPGAGTILIFAALTGILFFIPSLLVSKLGDQEKSSKRMIYFLGAAGLICFILGLLFKIQHWPLATTLQVAGLLLISVVVFPWYTFATWKEENNISARFIYMVIGTIAVVVPCTLLNLSLQRSYENSYFNHQAEQQAMFNYLSGKNQAFLKNNNDSAMGPVLMKINSGAASLLQVINGVEAKMIAESEGKSGNPAILTEQIKQTENGPEIQFYSIKGLFKYEPVEDFLMPGCTTREELDSKLKEYADYLVSLTPGGELGRLGKILDPSVCLPVEDLSGDRTSLMAGLHSLGLVKNSILIAESEAFSVVSKHSK